MFETYQIKASNLGRADSIAKLPAYQSTQAAKGEIMLYKSQSSVHVSLRGFSRGVCRGAAEQGQNSFQALR